MIIYSCHYWSYQLSIYQLLIIHLRIQKSELLHTQIRIYKIHEWPGKEEKLIYAWFGCSSSKHKSIEHFSRHSIIIIFVVGVLRQYGDFSLFQLEIPGDEGQLKYVCVQCNVKSNRNRNPRRKLDYLRLKIFSTKFDLIFFSSSSSLFSLSMPEFCDLQSICK